MNISKRKHFPSFRLRKIYGFLIIFLYVLFCVFTKNTNHSIAIPTPTPLPACLATGGSIEPLDSRISRLIKKYNSDMTIWPIIKSSQVTHTLNHRGITIKVTDRKIFTNHRISLLIKAINKAPQILLNYRPQTIYLITPDDLIYPEERNLAIKHDGFTSGPNIHIFPNLFEKFQQPDIDALLFHEWGHIIQFYNYSSFINNYLAQVGWSSSVKTKYVLAGDSESQKQTNYGKTHPAEDQAETISLFITNNFNLLSTARLNWVKIFLGCK